MNTTLMITLYLLGIVLVPVAVFYIFRLLANLYKGYIRRAQSTYYSRDSYVTLRMRVPRTNEKGPLVMEQIFASLYGVFKKPTLLMTLLGFGQDKFSLEIVNNQGKIYFYVQTHKRLQRLIEGQFYAQYPGVEIEVVKDYLSELDVGIGTKQRDLAAQDTKQLVPAKETKEADYKEFLKVNPLHNAIVAEMKMFGAYLWPIKTHKEFVSTDDKTIIDPLSSVTTAISTLNFPSDIASIQYVIRPENHLWQRFGWSLYNNYLKKGFFRAPPSFMDWFIKWYSVPSFFYHFLIWFPIQFLKIIWIVFGKVKPVENLNALERQEVGFTIWEVPKKKLTTLGFQTDIRLMYVPMNADTGGAYNKIKEMAAGFNQFQYPYVNGFAIARIGSDKELIRRFAQRDFYEKMILGIDELATIFHLPILSLETPNIQWVLSKKLEPPADLPRPGKGEEITVLGKTNFRGYEDVFGIKTADRRRHIYIIGKTGMGKSTLLENMVYSDIHAGKGVAVIDPHGDLADYVVSIIPATRINDAIIFNPADRDFPVSFNMLEVTNPDQRNLVASGLLGIFKKMYADSWGPRLEHILRNTILALTEYPGATMLGIMRILIDPVYREKVVEKVTDPVVHSFWIDEFGKMDQKFRTEAIAPIQNKVGQFLSAPIVRNILGQPKSSLNIRFAMDTNKIIVVNLSKGKIGEDNSSLLGSMLVTKFQLDAMSRADVSEDQRKDFYLFVDEFQNFATDSFATILSEARKYKLNLTMANQYIEQMSEEVQAAVFGNVGSIFTFQVGFDDADYIAKQFADEEMVNDILSLEKYTGYMRLLVDNMPTKPFSVKTLPSPPSDKDMERINKLIKVSRERYSNERLLVEDKIKRWSEAAQNALSESKKLPPGAVSEDDLRHEKNKEEFEQVLTDAGLNFKLIPKESYENMGIDKATNEHVYYFEVKGKAREKALFCFSSLDPQGNCFKKKRSEMIRFFEQDPKTKMFTPIGSKVQKNPYWKHYLRQSLEEFGGKAYELPQGVPENEEYDYRHSGNRKEFEEILSETGLKFELIPREKYDRYGVAKSVNEHVYLVKNHTKQMLVLSSIDPQGDVFRKKKFDSIKFAIPGDSKVASQVAKEMERDVSWKKQLRKRLTELEKIS